MVDKTEQSDRTPNPNEKPEICYCSALPKGSGLCLPCYTRYTDGEFSRGLSVLSRSLADLTARTMPYPE
jgi:hypothetical protein